jgi:outer membrane protein assembly factor BamB
LFLHVGGHDSGALTAFDAKTGEPRWNWNKDGPGYSSPILAQPGGVKQLITQSQNFAIGVSPGGKLLWSVPYKTDYDQNSVSPVVVGDLVIVSGVHAVLRLIASRRTAANWPRLKPGTPTRPRFT